MATYKVWLTVKDSFGNTKEVDGGTINVDLATLTPDELDQIEEHLPLENYLKKEEIDTELEHFATDTEVERVVEKKETIKYASFFDDEELVEPAPEEGEEPEGPEEGEDLTENEDPKENEVPEDNSEEV
jgi:hypothetical protein